MGNCDDKDDLDLDAQDLAAMADGGEDVTIIGPTFVPSGGVFFTAPTTFGARASIIIRERLSQDFPDSL